MLARGVCRHRRPRWLIADHLRLMERQVTDFVPSMAEGQLRICDVDLAERLGFARPVKIRDLIKPHCASLEAMGPSPRWGGSSTAVGRLSST